MPRAFRDSRPHSSQAIEEEFPKQLVGTIQIRPRYAFVVPDSRKIKDDVYIPQSHLMGANDQDKVLVEILEIPSRSRKASGKVIEILGKSGENDTEMHAILMEYGLPYHFPEAVEAEAEAIPTEIPETEIAKRRDLRSVMTFTIDPKDAKDFDDALSYQVLKNGHLEVGVHIADVSHYVRPGTLLDQEAYARATSVYLVDRVVPMLPENLSNGLCSLRPKEDKLCFSAIFELDGQGQVHAEWFGRTIIHSQHRFAYEEAQVIIEDPSKDSVFGPILEKLNGIARRLREARFEKGSVNFDTVELKFELDANGKPLSVYARERKAAHELIEEYMLLANRRVASFVHSLRKPAPLPMVYRVHEAPDPEKLQVFSSFAKKLGYQVATKPLEVSASFNRLMEAIEGKPEAHVLQALAVRTMSKARYGTEEIGHFGLAFPYYSHFTSPIRRYPDVMTHRLLAAYLEKAKELMPREQLEAQCKHCSDREKLAADAERASVKYKQVEYMSLQAPRTYEGIVSGVTEFGFFVELEDTSCEGLVRMADLNDDYYELDKANYRIVGRRSGRSFTFGDRVQVTVRQTNLLKRSIDLDLVGMQRERKQKKHPFQSPRKKPNNRVVPKGKKRQSKIGRKRKP